MATLPDTPVTGEATKVSWAEGVIDYLSNLNSRIGTGGGTVPANGSFELDTNEDGDPDSWDVTEASATLSLDSADSVHARQSVKFIFGATSGTGTVTNADFLECAEGQRLELSYHVKGSWENSAGGLPHKAQILFYNDATPVPVATSTVTLVDEGDTPIVWSKYFSQTVVPNGAYHYKVRLQAGDGSTGVSSETINFDLVGVRVFHGHVYLATADKVDIYSELAPSKGTKTIAVTPAALGGGFLEQPISISFSYAGTMPSNDDTDLTFKNGDGDTVNTHSIDNSGNGTTLDFFGGVSLFLSPRGEFTMIIGEDDPPINFTLTLSGYDV